MLNAQIAFYVSIQLVAISFSSFFLTMAHNPVNIYIHFYVYVDVFPGGGNGMWAIADGRQVLYH